MRNPGKSKKVEKLPVKASARPGVALFVEKFLDSASLKRAHKSETLLDLVLRGDNFLQYHCALPWDDGSSLLMFSWVLQPLPVK